ncbi:MAG: hypothetical protein ACFCU6_00560, partial [Balneolaceae bacterium]
MLFLRWLHKIWSFLLYTTAIVLTTLLVVLVLLMGVLQLPASKDYILKEITELYNNNFEGTLKVNSITGLLPFHVTLNEPGFYLPEDSTEAVLSLEQISIKINAWDLLRRQLTISGFDMNKPNLELKRNPDTDLYTISEVFASKEGKKSGTESESPAWLKSYSIFAPLITIIDGSVYIQSLPAVLDDLELNPPFTVDNITASVFLEVNQEQRFLELNHFSASIDDT